VPPGAAGIAAYRGGVLGSKLLYISEAVKLCFALTIKLQ
jgi:hypothetical protein